MSTPCENLYRFLDAELPPDARNAFQDHLPDCEACALAFQESLQLELLGQMALEPSPGALPNPAQAAERWRWDSRQGWVAATMALAAGVAALLLHQPDPWHEWRVSNQARSLEARVAYPELAPRYRQFVPDRGEAGASPKLPVMTLGQMARLEAREDLHGVATAHLLNGSPGQARLLLEKMPRSADRDSDLAVVELLEALDTRAEGDLTLAHRKQTRLDQALELLDGALRQKPDHPPALWNRALVLRELGLPLLAAESFEAVALRPEPEPGWRTEAAENAQRLRKETEQRRDAWKRAFAATRDLMMDMRARLPEAEAHGLPGIVRLAFYDAVRSAPSREDVLRLLPLAEALDGEYGGGVLSGYVRRVAGRDFNLRGPLARQYAGLAWSGKPEPALLDALRSSGEDDLYLGALVYASSAGLPVDREALARLAEAQDDPWMQLVAERERALLEVQAGAWWKAEQRLLAALDTCEEQRLVYRCLGLERQLTDLYLGLHRPADAFRHAWTAWQRVRASGEWMYEQQFLQELADIARFQKRLPSARAYLEESLLRMPEDCAQRTHVHRNLARLELEGFRPDGARSAVDHALRCEQPLGLTGALVLSDLARVRYRPGDEDHLRRALAELRRPGVSSGFEALLLFIEGQFLRARGSPEGEALLWRAVELAERTPGDVDARKARAYAYGALVSDAGKQGAWSEALKLMGRALRLEPVPGQCVLAVSVQNERTVVLARGRGGALRGTYDGSRKEPLRGSAEGLVPDAMLAALRDCEHVDVLALPPVHGLTGLLPGNLAWSYRVGRTEPPPAAPPGLARRLIVTDVAGPAALGLPKLDGLSPPRLPDPWRVELRGSQATPSRVLEAMVDAAEVELHAHGMTSPAVSDASLVVLAPDRDGSYALTADRVRATRLRRAPLVLLATCGGARTAPFPHEPFSLPVAFIEAGARAVLASSVDIPNSAGEFFEEVRERIRAGIRPSVALKEVRQRWQQEPRDDGHWLPHVLLFE
jgi:tetratricopeptide (TPR) repeat protein